MATIGIHTSDDVVYNTSATSYDYHAGYARTKYSFTIICDGSENINHFYIASNKVDWIHINRMRNIIDVTIDENCSLKGRYGIIRFVHTLNKDVYMELNIIQEAHEYSISIDKDSVTFDSLLDQTDSDSETEYITVTAQDGLADYGIKPVQEYVKSDSDSEYHEITYDDGLKIYKLNDGRLAIRNFGKVSLYYDNYYVITVYHINDISKYCTITVRYTLDTTSGFSVEEDD